MAQEPMSKRQRGEASIERSWIRPARESNNKTTTFLLPPDPSLSFGQDAWSGQSDPALTSQWQQPSSSFSGGHKRSFDVAVSAASDSENSWETSSASSTSPEALVPIDNSQFSFLPAGYINPSAIQDPSSRYALEIAIPSQDSSFVSQYPDSESDASTASSTQSILETASPELQTLTTSHANSQALVLPLLSSPEAQSGTSTVAINEQVIVNPKSFQRYQLQQVWETASDAGTVRAADPIATRRVARNGISIPRREIYAIPSPFRDCRNTFGKYPRKSMPLPNGGVVNSYIKFVWAKPRSATSETQGPDSGANSLSHAVYAGSLAVGRHRMLDMSSKPAYTPTQSPITISHPPSFPPPEIIPNENGVIIRYPSGHKKPVYLPHAPEPRLLPRSFGWTAKLNDMDRRLWNFYIKNWCPGRAILRESNLWLNDFPILENKGVRCAIMSLAGVYIYDYQPIERISARVNHLFNTAERKLSQLLRAADQLTPQEVSDAVTIAVLLSMQDVVFVERREQMPKLIPRWLQGFTICERLLERVDPGSRYWSKENVQSTSLSYSQGVIVARAVILAQPMMPLMDQKSFDLEQQVNRFGWLLYGSEEGAHEVQGGCGFSRKLLHILSQITCLSNDLLHNPGSYMAPSMSKSLLGFMKGMKQWSRATFPWSEAPSQLSVIERYATRDNQNQVIYISDMTDLTAEAWRFAAMIYLQCRLDRLPRNHPQVLANMEKLAFLIRIMPTSGGVFTAQAPLFPVFLLGLLATELDHISVAMVWFHEVVKAPVRSSVPPLFEALVRIRAWLEVELPVSPDDDFENLPKLPGQRNAWWEEIVAMVYETEPQMLCLT